jgi:hypothetical protein
MLSFLAEIRHLKILVKGWPDLENARKMGGNKRSAVGFKSGKPVANSGPVLRRPTPPTTAGRNPEACFSHPSQPKSWPGRGAGSPAGAEDLCSAPDVNEAAISDLLLFFRILDKWDRAT